MLSESAISSRLLSWYDRQKRDLPWRRTRDPWAILVSEVMLQQTRVEVVVDYYEAFLERFPGPAALARAEEADLLSLWSGLGYYRRARNLRKAAAMITDQFNGEFPSDHAAMLSLPGVGRYTAGAVGSIAFDMPSPVVDGNVIRVLARLFLVRGDAREKAVSDRLWALAEELLDRARPGDFNQALMELGAMVCLPRTPRCLLCPVAAHCLAREKGLIDEYPTPRRRKPTVPVRLIAVLIHRDRSIALLRRAPGSLMEGLFDVPAIEVGADDDARALLKAWLRDRFGLGIRGLEPIGLARHTITHRRITVEVFEAYLAGRETAALIREAAGTYGSQGIAPDPDDQGIRFVAKHQVKELGLSALGKKALRVGGLPI